MKVVAIKTYNDTEFKKLITKGDVFEVSEKRGNVLIEAAVALGCIETNFIKTKKENEHNLNIPPNEPNGESETKN